MNERGSALVETALVMAIVLMVTFGTIQVATIAFSQLAQDGAVFVGAREYAQNAAGGASVAQSTAHGAFSHVKASDIAINATVSSVTASAVTTLPGLGVPGTPGTFPLESSFTEPVNGNPNPAAGAFPFSTAGTLTNYRDYASNVPNPNYTIVTAQTFGNGNGTNGFFAEFDCRQKSYSKLSFPNYPSRRTSFWDPIHGNYSAIYNWDTGATCR